MESGRHGSYDEWSLAFRASRQRLVEAGVHLAERDLAFPGPTLRRQRTGFALPSRHEQRPSAAVAGYRSLAELGRISGNAHNTPPLAWWPTQARGPVNIRQRDAETNAVQDEVAISNAFRLLWP